MSSWSESVARHLDDLRLRSYEGAEDRRAQEELFEQACEWLDPVVTSILHATNEEHLGGQGEFNATGPQELDDGTKQARWRLTWNELKELGFPPVQVAATFYSSWQHPHLHGWCPGIDAPHSHLSCLGDWPLQVSAREDAELRRSVVEAIVEAEMHNRVFRAGIAMMRRGEDANEAWRTIPHYSRQRFS